MLGHNHSCLGSPEMLGSILLIHGLECLEAECNSECQHCQSGDMLSIIADIQDTLNHLGMTWILYLQQS